MRFPLDFFQLWNIIRLELANLRTGLKLKENRLLFETYFIARNVRYQMKGYLTVKETAEKWGVSVRWVNRYIQEGRLPGCEKLGTVWAVPEDAVKPEKLAPGPKPEKRLFSMQK